MNATLDEIRQNILGLPVEQRAELADWLRENLDGAESREILDEWLDVAEQRLADMEAGRTKGVPAEEVFKAMKSGGPTS